MKQKRKEKAGKWSVPIPKVNPVTDDEMFKVVKSGKRKRMYFPACCATPPPPTPIHPLTQSPALPPYPTDKAWKRMVTKVTFVGEGFTRKPPKYERFIRPMALRFKKAHVTHPELQTTFHLKIMGVKKNPSSALYSQLGVITKGTIIEVNVSELGMVTTSGKVVWGMYQMHCTRARATQQHGSGWLWLTVHCLALLTGKYAQVTNNPERDGCINAVLLV